MDEQRQDTRYEALYTQLLERGLVMHINNKKRIKVGLIILVLLPVILDIIRILTGSDKIVFLIIWVICMFVLCIYLIWIEYIDDSVQKTLEEVTDTEADFDVLMIGTDQIGERLSEKHEQMMERRAHIQERLKALRESSFGGLNNLDDESDEEDETDEPESEGEE